MSEWDESERVANLTKHGVDFATIEAFEWPTAIEFLDDRHSNRRPE